MDLIHFSSECLKCLQHCIVYKFKKATIQMWVQKFCVKFFWQDNDWINFALETGTKRDDNQSFSLQV